MSYLAATMQKELERTFADSNLTIHIRSNYIEIENSKNLTEKKVQQVVNDARLYPIVSRDHFTNNLVFTVSPYKLLECFKDLIIGQMVNIDIEDQEQKCREIQSVLGKKVSNIQSCGIYSAIPRSSTEFERKLAADNAMPDGTYRYAHAFKNTEPLKVKWFISSKVIVVALPEKLQEQHGRHFSKWYTQVEKTCWFCSKGDYFLTLRPATEEDLETGLWKGSIEERQSYFQKNFIEADLFGEWIDHWDCLKGGMKQPTRRNFLTGRGNYSDGQNEVFTFNDLLDPNILGKNPDLFKRNPKIFDLLNK